MNFQVRTVSFREGVTTMIYPSVIFAVENTSVPFIIIFLLKDGGHKERKNTNMLLSLGPKDLGDALKAAMAEPGPSGYGVGSYLIAVAGWRGWRCACWRKSCNRSHANTWRGHVVMARQTNIFRGFYGK